MDRSLDDVIASRPRGQRGQRGRRPNGYPRDGVRKPSPRESQNLDQDWVHDRFYDDDNPRSRRTENQVDRRNRSPAGRGEGGGSSGYKLKVENLHYEITEDDVRELFSRVGPVTNISLVYDRQDRSTGVAYITYTHMEDAVTALNEFNGQNAYKQPIYLTMLPSRDAAPPSRRDAEPSSRASRSLFDRIENPVPTRRGGRDRRSLSPAAQGPRHSDVSKPAPEHIDRYVPGQRDHSRRRSPRRGGPGRERGGQGRRAGTRRDQGRRDDQGHQMVQGRPRKTQEELDAEMDDYFGQSQAQSTNEGKTTGSGAGAPGADNDIDMIE